MNIWLYHVDSFFLSFFLLSVSGGRKVTIRELMSALSERDLKALHDIAEAIQTFDRRHSLKQTITRDRSAPRLDNLLACQLSIQHFDPALLRKTFTRVHHHPVVVMDTTGDSSILVKGDEWLCDARPMKGYPDHDQRLGEAGPARRGDPDDRCDCEGDQMSGSGNSSRTDVQALLAESSTSSEDSDIFIREKDYVKYITIEPTSTELVTIESGKSADISTPSRSHWTQYKQEPHVTAIVSPNHSPSADSTCLPIHHTPPNCSQVVTRQLAGQVTEDAASCGSDAEADFFFKDKAKGGPDAHFPYRGGSEREGKSQKSGLVGRGNDLNAMDGLSSGRGCADVTKPQKSPPTGKVIATSEIKCDDELTASGCSS